MMRSTLACLQDWRLGLDSCATVQAGLRHWAKSSLRQSGDKRTGLALHRYMETVQWTPPPDAAHGEHARAASARALATRPIATYLQITHALGHMHITCACVTQVCNHYISTPTIGWQIGFAPPAAMCMSTAAAQALLSADNRYSSS